jgi:acetyl-CoA carboxylase alpha subunit
VGRIPGSGWNLVTAVEAHRLGLVDLVIPEPEGSAARDPQGAATLLREAIGTALAGSNLAGSRRRVTERQQRIRSVGQTTPAGRDALRAELNDLRDLQRNIAKSVEDWRERWDQLRMGQRSLTIQRPDWTDMANRLRTRRAELLERASRIDRHLR